MGCTGSKVGSPSICVDLLRPNVPLVRRTGIESHVGDQLQGKDGPVPTATALKNKKAVLMYFAAATCPKCREFTALLIELYNTQAKVIGFEIVFVSGETSQMEFDCHFSTMPWYAVPFKYSFQMGLHGKRNGCGPDLAILGADGRPISSEGILNLDISACIGASRVPQPTRMIPRPIVGSVLETLGDTFLKGDGSTVGGDAFGGGMFGIYFGASWCSPCRKFAAALKSFCQDYHTYVPDFQVVYVSSDSDERAMMTYFQEMHSAFLALPFSRRKEKVSLTTMLGVQGLPTFVILSAGGHIVSADARGRVEAGVPDVLANGWAPAA